MLYSLVKKLFPICRSITGNGTRETLKELQKIVPEMKLYEVPTGTKVLDWTIPKEWNINDAWIKNSKGEKIIDFKKSNLHVMGYSTPVHKKVNLKELLEVVYTLPEQPDLIPYITSYYRECYCFCMSENQKKSLVEDEYEIFIDSELKDGSLTYADIVIPGETKDEILFSTYVCHPSMANNELSGPAVAIYLAKWLKERKNRYTYRFVFCPETIGSITYLSKNMEHMKKYTKAGFVLTCCGDEGEFSYLESPNADTLADRVVRNVLRFEHPNYNTFSFLRRGSDERQYCAPGIDLPVVSVMKSLYTTFPEYHTSGDNLDFVSPKGLNDSYEFYKKVIISLENNYNYRLKCFGEPQLGKRGLYPNTSTKESCKIVVNMMNFIAFCDGKRDLIEISDRINVSLDEILEYVDKFLKADLIEKVCY